MVVAFICENRYHAAVHCHKKFQEIKFYVVF
jgi:hypothetical protein